MQRTAAALLSLALVPTGITYAQSAAGPTFAAQQALLAQRSPIRDLATVSPEAQHAIQSFKDALVTSTDAVLKQSATTATADDVRSALSRQMPAEDVGSAAFKTAAAAIDKAPNSSDSVAGLYGSGLRIRVTQARPDFLLVQEGFVLPCGDDTVLLGYHAGAGGWSRVLRWQSKPYSNHSDAFGDSFAATALTAESGGLPMIAIKHGHPACASTTSKLSLAVLQLSSTAEPKLLWSSEQDYRRFDLQYLSRLEQTADGFAVRASFPSLDPEQLGKEVTRRYRVSSQGVERTSPLASRAADIVDEWFQMPWSEARAYIDSADKRDLEGIHFRVHKDSGSHQHVGPVEYLTQRSCNDSPTRQQVELDLRPDDPKMSETAIVLVEPAADHPIRFAAAALDPACDGADQLHTVARRPHIQ